MALLRSPLDRAHRALGARMAPFGGWEMPLQYDKGTLHEHRACRGAVAVFDVSHLGTVRVGGPRSFEALQAVFTNDLGRVQAGRAQYTHLLDPADGSVQDDLIIWWLPDRFEVMPNASNTGPVTEALRDVAGAGDLDIRDVTRERAMLAVQGPKARGLLEAVLPEAAKVGRFRVAEATWQGTPVTVAGTGYTGEDGVELTVPSPVAEALWAALVDHGAEPAGLGARDTLRLEAGLPLHGHELGPGITPLQAGLGWVVSWDKGDFRGRAALAVEHARGPERRLRGLLVEGRRPPREGSAVLQDGTEVGVVTSGNFSPMLEQGIALALVRAELEPGARLTLDLRGKPVGCQIVPLPFVRRD